MFTAARIWSWGCLPNVSSAKRSRRKANRPSFHGPLVHGTPGRGRLPPQGPCARLASGNPASSPGWLGRLRPSPGRRPPPGAPCPWGTRRFTFWPTEASGGAGVRIAIQPAGGRTLARFSACPHGARGRTSCLAGPGRRSPWAAEEKVTVLEPHPGRPPRKPYGHQLK